MTLLKQEKLIAYLKQFNQAAIAFSGGIDSSYLLWAAQKALGEKAMAFTVDAPFMLKHEIIAGAKFAANLGVKHYQIKLELPQVIQANPPLRCYYCKKYLMENLLQEAKKLDFADIFDGSNLDDDQDYRPGQKALQELKIRSPLKRVELSKVEIRQLAKAAGLNFWAKPADSCLLTRFQAGAKITTTKLEKIQAIEDFLRGKGFWGIRARVHNDLLRLELAPQDVTVFIQKERKATLNFCKAAGFKFVTVDLAGYQMGSTNLKVGEE